MPLFTRTSGNYYRASTAILTGDVSVGALASFWFGAVVRGDVAPIVIGSRVNVQDNAVVHCDTGVPNVIEDDVTIGHAATVHGTLVGRGSLVGMGATLLSRSVIGEECIVAAGAVVPPDMRVPARHLVVGVPAKVARPLDEKDLSYLRWLTEHYVEVAQKYVDGEIREKQD